MRKSTEHPPVNPQSKFSYPRNMHPTTYPQSPQGLLPLKKQSASSRARLIRTLTLDIVAPVSSKQAPVPPMWCLQSGTHDICLSQA